MSLATCVEVPFFKFRQLKKFNITDESDKRSEKSVGLLAASTRFGFIFAGHSNGFKVVLLRNILSIEESESGKNSQKPIEQFPHLQVTLPSDPFLLALSTDEMTLAVGVMKGQCPVALLYDIRVFLTSDPAPASFLEIRLSATPGTKVLDFFWNPGSGDTFAVCLSDGCVSVYEISSSNTFRVAGSLPSSTGATSLCWSPKGKQLVIGKRTGHLSQYKPNLGDCVKTVEQPNTFQNAMLVSSVLWLETHLFAAVYQNPQDDSQPSLILVSVPKGQNPSYLNFNDVCYGNGDGPTKYWMHHIPTWKAMVCCSSSALETAVIGIPGDKGIWEQWILEDTARAELPMVKSMETYPLGLAVISCSQNRIVVSETESYPPMPILLLLSTSGQLCPFHMIHTACTTSLVTAPETLQAEGVRRPAVLPTQALPPAQTAPLPVQPVTPKGLGIAGSVLGQPVHMSTPLESVSKPEHSANTPKTNLIQKFTEESPKPTSLFAPLTKPEAQRQEMKPVASPGALAPQPGAFAFQNASQNVQVCSPPKSAVDPTFPVSSGSLFRPTNVPALTPQLPASTSAAAANSLPPPNTTSKTPRPTLTAVAPSKNVLKMTSQDTTKAAGDTTYVQAFFDEINDFQREIDELSNTLGQKLNLGTPEEMGLIRKSTQDAVNFSSEIKTTLQSIQSDVTQLKSALIETFALLEEARSRDLRDRDPVYLNLLRGRALDPCSQRQLKEVRRLAQYVSGQLNEVHLKLDIDWQEQLQKSKNNQTKASVNQQGLTTLYQALANNLAVIDCLETSLAAISQQYKDLKSSKDHSHSKQIQSMNVSDLSTKLESTTLSNGVSKSSKPILNKYSAGDTSVTARRANRSMGKQQENALRELLMQRPVRVVKAKPIADLSQSRLVSALHTLQMSSSTPVKKVETPVTSPAPPIQTNQRPPVTAVLPQAPAVSISPASFASVAGPPPNVSVASTASIFSGRITKGQPFKPVTDEPKVVSIPTSSMTTKLPISGAIPIAFSAKSQASAPIVSVQPQTTSTPVFSVFQPKTTSTTAPSTSGLFSLGKIPVPSVTTPQVTIQPVISTIATTAVNPFPDLKFQLSPANQPVVASRSEAKGPCPRFENITPPESPQPAAEIQEENVEATSPTEESKVIHISLNNQEADGKPLVKVSSLQASSAAQVIASSAQPAASASAQTPANQVSFSFKAAVSPPSTNTTPSTGFSLSHLKTSDAPSLTTPSTSSTSSFQFSTPTWGLGSGSAFTQPKFSFITSAEKTSTDSTTTITTTTAVSLGVNTSSTASSTITASSTPSLANTGFPGVATTQSSKIPATIFTAQAKSFQPVPTAASTVLSTALTTSQSAFTMTAAASTVPPTQPIETTPKSVESSSPPETVPKVVDTSETSSKSSTVVQPTVSVPSGLFTSKPANAGPSLFGHLATGTNFGQTTSGSTFGQAGSGSFFGQAVFGAAFGQAASNAAVTQAVTGAIVGQATSGATTVTTSSDQESLSAKSTVTTINTTVSTTVSSTVATVPPVAPTNTTADSTSTPLPVSTSAPTLTTSSSVSTLPATSIAGSSTAAPDFNKSVISTTAAPSFGQVPTTSPTAFSQPGATAFSSTPAVATSNVGGIFGQSIPDVTPASTAATAFGQVGVQAPTMFGQPANSTTQTSSIFNQAGAAQGASSGGLFSGSSGSLTFGQPAGQATFGQAGQSVFGKAPVFGTSTFGQPQPQPQPSTSTSLTFGTVSGQFGQPVTSSQAMPVFGQAPAFGQAPTFGQQSAFGQKPVFGQTGGSVFGQTSSSTTGSMFGQQQQPQSNAGGSTAGGTGSTPFSGGNFFMGLGGKPSEENAGKNVFGGNFAGASGAGPVSNTLFGSQGASTFGSPQSSGFSGSFSTGGSVAQSGFAAFQQTPPRTSAFGSPPAFGSSPVFSGSPVFGSAPNFGNTFGQPSPSAASGTFGTFGNNSAPSFDTLAAQSPTFSNLAQQSPAAQTSQAATTPAFGSPPAFGGQFPSQSSAFSHWRQ